MIIVRSERRLPPTKGISEYPSRMGPGSSRRVIQVRVVPVLGYVSVEPWDPTRRVFPLQGGVFPSRPIQSFKLSHMVTGVTRAGGKLKY